jgi:hypothetical protein
MAANDGEQPSRDEDPETHFRQGRSCPTPVSRMLAFYILIGLALTKVTQS